MKALILAAGQGRRLRPLTDACPKCLLSIGAHSILERQLLNLEQCGIGEIVLVCGFGIEQIRQRVANYSGSLHIKILYNPFYAISENLISLWAVRSEMNEDFLLLNGDNVFHPGIIHKLLAAREPYCLMIDRKISYDEDDMKLSVQDTHILRIGKLLPAAATDAASIGIMKFAGTGIAHIRRVLEEIVLQEKAVRGYFLDSVQHLINHGYTVTYREVDGLPWADIDTPEDLQTVRQQPHLYQEDAVLQSSVSLRDSGGDNS